MLGKVNDCRVKEKVVERLERVLQCLCWNKFVSLRHGPFDRNDRLKYTLPSIRIFTHQYSFRIVHDLLTTDFLVSGTSNEMCSHLVLAGTARHRQFCT